MLAALGSCFDYRTGLTRTIAGSSLPGYVDGAGSSARFSSIQSVAWTPAASFLVLVDSGNAIRRIDAMSGETSALAGDANNGCVVRDGVGSEARFCRPKHVRITTDASTVWVLSEDGKSVTPLSSQDEQATLSDANSLIAVSESETSLAAGALVTVVVLERRYL